jgi:hypothetical protein
MIPKDMYENIGNEEPQGGEICNTCGRDLAHDKEITVYYDAEKFFCDINGKRWKCFDNYTVNEFSSYCDYVYEMNKK